MEASSEDLATLASRLSRLASELATDSDPQAKKAQKQALVAEAKKAIWQVQDPVEAILEHTINAYTSGSISALIDIGVFEAIPPSGSATSKEIAQKCDADEQLIIRLMRQLVCVNIFQEVKLHEWAHNRLSIGLSEHVGMSGKWLFKVSQDEMAPGILKLNQYMKQYGKKDVHTYTETPHSWAHDMNGKNFWQVLTSDPTRLDVFNRGLSLFAAMHPVVAMVPFEEKFQPGNSASRPFIVDVGGGRGLALLEFRRALPNLQGELILQDRQQVLDTITSTDLPGVTKMAHDFFTPQPVHNAQIYHIRRVMHDWQDNEAAQILRAIKPAMGPDSCILVADMALPDPVTTRDAHAVWLDLMMMTIGGKERTHADWATLADMSGLRLVKVWQEQEKYGPLAMVEYRLPETE